MLVIRAKGIGYTESGFGYLIARYSHSLTGSRAVVAYRLDLDGGTTPGNGIRLRFIGSGRSFGSSFMKHT